VNSILAIEMAFRRDRGTEIVLMTAMFYFVTCLGHTPICSCNCLNLHPYRVLATHNSEYL
jgi:hypothetical protein